MALEKKDVDEKNKWTRQKIKEIESFVNSKSSDMEEWVDTVNGGVNGNGVIARDGKWVKGLNVQWPVVVIGSTVVAATVVIYVFSGKRR
ncbi:hypothetical protein AHAS_Ahas20G0160800 [Arachis hypogaea]